MGVKGSDIRIARNDGIVAWGTIVSFAESPKRAGVLYTGTDDGNLHVSRDGGKDWASVSDRVPDLPKETFVSEVVPSRFDEATVYATFDGHRNNDFETHIYASTDYGQNWRSIAANLKGEIARTLTEDLKNPDVLYLGTETGLFITIDRGRSWQRIKANLPTVRIDEITLHPRDNAMILATHGRVIWILDNLAPIQEYAAAESATADAKLFSPAPAAMYRGPRATGTTSSGETRSSTGRTRPRPPSSPGCSRNRPAKSPCASATPPDDSAGDLRNGARQREQGRHPLGVLGPSGAAVPAAQPRRSRR